MLTTVCVVPFRKLAPTNPAHVQTLPGTIFVGIVPTNCNVTCCEFACLDTPDAENGPPLACPVTPNPAKQLPGKKLGVPYNPPIIPPPPTAVSLNTTEPCCRFIPPPSSKPF